MEDVLITTENEANNCPSCNHTVAADLSFCASCGYPLKGTPEQQAHFTAHRQLKKREQEKHLKKIHHAKVVLYILAGLTGLITFLIPMSSTIQMALGADDTNMVALFMVVLGIISLIYLGSAIWANKKPFAALLVGFIFFTTIQLLGAVLEPESLFKGVIFKVLFFILLLNGFISANKLKQLDKELEA